MSKVNKKEGRRDASMSKVNRKEGGGMHPCQR